MNATLERLRELQAENVRLMDECARLRGSILHLNVENRELARENRELREERGQHVYDSPSQSWE